MVVARSASIFGTDGQRKVVAREIGDDGQGQLAPGFFDSFFASKNC
jgi:hypothetical protein